MARVIVSDNQEKPRASALGYIISTDHKPASGRPATRFPYGLSALGYPALILLLALPAAAQTEHFEKAGSCGRCHVISVIEWGISGHARTGTDCIACHGQSEGHVIDERNNIKPEKIPRGAAVTGFCATCHTGACPKSKKTEGCADCHHFHALVDPSKPAIAKDERLDRLAADWQQADRLIVEGEQLIVRRQWKQARAKFDAALKLRDSDPVASARVKVCDGWLRTAMPGFEIVDAERDAASGLPKRVRVSGLGIEMVLVPGGEFDIGSEQIPNAKPVHTVRIEPVYMAKYEMTQQHWTALMGSNPSAFQQSPNLPVEQVSWDDAQAMLGKLNARVQGGGFRLPTEAEWEYAARAGETTSESARVGESSPRPVGEGQPNKFGLYDMRGNVWEWCSSLFKPYPYVADDGRESPSALGMRVLKGGGFQETAENLDPALRHAERADRKFRYNGVRLARGVM